MKVNVEMLPVMDGLIYGDFGITITKGKFSNTYMYDRIFSIELSDNFMKLRLVNDMIVKIQYAPYRITITEPELEVDTDDIPDDLLPRKRANDMNLN